MEPKDHRMQQSTTDTRTQQSKKQEVLSAVAIAERTHDEQTYSSGSSSGHTDQLGNGIRTKENTLLHSGGIEFHRQVGKNGDDDREVHHIHKDCDIGNHDDLLLLQRERHDHVTLLGITCVYEKDNGRTDGRTNLWRVGSVSNSSFHDRDW